ncbi:hypothetical protein AMES_3683 [Amycolatopsis mediterranei S699]|uniref:SDR family NAD(P)-dependent oxidoreductase n=1 Tax=Amycolatopsis mediterranei (strain U-32) TaxID=749927 RepID=A0A0H3D5F6_AMYMU|nr:conserved hypothetical protein [Amycolatopsis mediterranei U32]AFO77219.1 hypothetical protein AMES_3683 [Amycolatopsis mediterranei S699]AGT84347.1 hypothetical protein B737_3683 [Amycolatopsis mediterranei RB]
MVTDVVRAPPPAELVAAGRELADQVVQPLVVRVATGFGVQDFHADVGEEFPVRVEPARRGVEELEPGDVRRLLRARVDLGVERPREAVRGQQIHPSVADERGPFGDRVEDLLQTAAWRPLLHLRPSPQDRARAVRGPGEGKQVRSFRVVELERPRHGVQHGGGHAGEVPAFQLRVVLDADVGQHRDLAAAQPRYPPVPAGGQAGPIRADLGPPRDEELTDFLTVVHATTISPAARPKGALPVHLSREPRERRRLVVPWIPEIEPDQGGTLPTFALVGAGPGLGLATARRFGAAGHPVALIARDAERLAELTTALARDGIRARAFPADVPPP